MIAQNQPKTLIACGAAHNCSGHDIIMVTYAAHFMDIGFRPCFMLGEKNDEE